VDLNDITSDYQNAEILRMLRDNDPELRHLNIQQHEGVVYTFVVGDGDDLGWLEYFIGRSTVLDVLCISDTPEDRVQIAALVRGIAQNISIRHLSIYPSIYGYLGEAGDHLLSSLPTVLQSESCCLTSLALRSIPLGDDTAVALADALKGNKSLKYLYLDPAALTSLTSDGWSAFSRLLCDTSSVSNTYHSNHTLREIGSSLDMTRSHYPQDVKQLLALNEQTDKHDVAIKKILKYHPNNFDVGPFLGDEGKLVPLVMSWFERVRGTSVLKAKWFQRVIRGISSEKAAVDGYRSHSSHKKRKNLHTLVLLCLLTLVLPSSLTLCVCLLQIVSLLLKE
jgi:hypothetical protein